MKNNHETPLKIAFVLPALTAGGAERVLITLMNNLDREQFSPVLITVRADGALGSLIAPDVPVRHLDCGRVSLSLPRLYRTLRALQPDIVVSTMAHMNLSVLLLKPFLPGVRFIVREAVVPSYLIASHSNLSFFLKSAYRLLYPLADVVISPAQAIIDEFKNPLGMSCKNHVLLPNPVDTERIRAAENLLLPQTTDRAKTVHFIAAGRLHSQKGFDRLIEKLGQEHWDCDWRLDILGEGDERPILQNLIDREKLGDRIHLRGFVENPWPLYAAADCFLLPSRSEGLPNVALEALACGTPVIAMAEAGGIGEISARAPEGSVTIADDMDGFIDAMKKITPRPEEKFRRSLLPASFQKNEIVARFSTILKEAK